MISRDMHSSSLTDQEITAREHDILGSPSRIAPLSIDELDEEARAMVIRLRESAGKKDHSQLPEVFGVMAKHPQLLPIWLEMGTALFQGVLSPRHRELAVLRVGWRCRAPYEWGQHVDIAKRIGLTDAEIERVIEGPSARAWSELEAAILFGVDELLEDQMISDATWNKLASFWSDQQLIEFLMMVGQYVATAYMQNSLRLRLHPGSRGLRHR